ncbi:MAG: DivIVA domain-containing protein [Actinomycetota bacterium]|nr:DivIVA domain-containing protein [Actinomycetota bacterium]
MLEAVVFVLTVAVVGALLFLGGSVLLGRGETRPPADPDRSPLELPEDRPVTADDVRGVRMSVTVRGYRMTEVDWLLEQLAGALEERDAAVAALRARLEQARRAPGTDDAPSPGAGAGGNGAHADA